MTGQIRIESLGPGHNRKNFTCGVVALERYFRDIVTRDIKRRVSNCFVAIGQGGEIAGYYTFAATSLPLGDLPPEQAKKLPRYLLVPAGLIGRLAVATAFQGRRIGGALIIDAVFRAARSHPTIFAIIVDAKDDRPPNSTNISASSAWRAVRARCSSRSPRRCKPLTVLQIESFPVTYVHRFVGT